jgi:hypothetical protein
MRDTARSNTVLDANGKADGEIGARLRLLPDRMLRSAAEWTGRQPRGLVIIALAALSWGVVGLVARGAMALLG